MASPPPDLTAFLNAGLGGGEGAPRDTGPVGDAPDLSEFLSPTPGGSPGEALPAPDLSEFIRGEGGARPTDSRTDEFARGVQSGTDQLQMTAFGLLNMLGRETNIGELQAFSERGIDRNLAEAQAIAPSVQGFSEVESMDDFFDWAAGGLGSALPSLGLAFSSGGLGGLVGRKAVEVSIRDIIKDRIIKDLTAKGILEDAAELTAERALRSVAGRDMVKNSFVSPLPNQVLLNRGFTRGAQVGVFAGSAPPQAGEAQLSLREAGIDAPGTALLAGAVGGLLEIAPQMRLLSNLFPGVDRAISTNFVRDFAKATGTQAVLEGSTEGAQEIIQLAALAYHDPNFDLMNADNATQVLDAFALGALVGGVTGGGSFAAGRAVAPAQRDAAPPPVTPPSIDPEPVVVDPDFEPADNTLFQEVRGRVDAVIQEQFTPAINTIRDAFQDGVNQTVAAFPAAAARVQQLSAPVRQAHAEFVEGHRPIIEDTKRFAREQMQWIYEQAEQLPQSARTQWIAKEIADVRAQVEEVAALLRDRANRVVDNLTERTGTVTAGEVSQGQVDAFLNRSGTPQEQLEEIQIGDVAEIESEFVFGKSGTRGENVVGFKNRSGSKSSARGLITELRQKFPSATDSTFVIREQPDGTFVVVLADAGQIPQLQEDEVVSEALETARKAVRNNPKKKKTAARLKNEDGTETLIDVVTLTHQGRGIGMGDNQTMEQAFATMAGALFARGLIDGTQLRTLGQKFDEVFPGKAKSAKLPDARTARGQEKIEAARLKRDVETRMEALTRQQRRAINEAVDARLEQEFQPEARVPEEGQTVAQIEKRSAISGAERRDRRVQLLDAALRNIDERVARGERLPNEDIDEADVNRLSQEVSPTGRRADVLVDDEGGRRQRVFDQGPEDRSEEIEGPRQTRGSTAKPRKRATPGARPKAKPRPQPQKGAKTLESKADVVVWMPGVPKVIREAVSDLTKQMSKLAAPGTKIRVVTAAGAQRLIDQAHPFAALASAGLTANRHAATITYNHSAKTALVILGPRSVTDLGRLSVSLMHEFGHMVHYQTWDAATKEEQDALIKAFQRDVRSGKRGTGRVYEKLLRDNPVARAKFLNKYGAEGLLAQNNMYEFREWMADQFVDWMTNRRQPKNAVERFYEKIRVKIDQMWNFINDNPGRFNQLNQTYADFIDGIARRIYSGDPTVFDRTAVSETNRGRPFEFLVSKDDATLTTGEVYRPPGISTQEWGALVKRLETDYPAIVNNAAKITDWLHQAYYLALAPSTSAMRALSKRGIKAADKLVVKFNRNEHGRAKRNRNYHQRMKLMKGTFLNTYETITRGMNEDQKADLLAELRAADRGEAGQARGIRFRQMRRLFDDMHDYLKKSGLPIGKIPNYFPRTFSREKLKNNQDKIIRYLQTAPGGNMSYRRATAFYNSLLNSEADYAGAMEELQADELSMQSPSFRNMRSRNTKAKFFDQFLDDNLDGIMANYIVAATKRGEYNRFLGSAAPAGVVGGDRLPKTIWNPQQRLDDILREARDQGATKDDLKRMKDYVDANLGMYGRDDVSDRVRTAMATVVAYQNMRVLLFTVFASLPDLVGPMIRSGDMKTAWRSYVNNVGKAVKNNSDLDEIARTWGIVSSVANQHVLTEYVDNHYMPPKVRKWNDAFFKWTGLNWYTDFTRKVALAVGMDYITNQHNIFATHPDPSVRQKARRQLAELGLNPAQVKEWIDNGSRIWGGVGYDANNSADQAVAEAMVQFVDESVLSPNPSQRPLLASHPAFMLVFHLKGFMYAMHDTILKRLVHNFNVAENPAQVMAAVAPAILMLALTALGLELRELLTGRRYTDRMDGWDYTWEITSRSGLLGITQMGWDFTQADTRGQAELAAIGGPTVSQLGDLISRPASQTIPKGIPVVSQLPWARDTLRDVTPL